MTIKFYPKLVHYFSIVFIILLFISGLKKVRSVEIGFQNKNVLLCFGHGLVVARSCWRGCGQVVVRLWSGLRKVQAQNPRISE